MEPSIAMGWNPGSVFTWNYCVFALSSLNYHFSISRLFLGDIWSFHIYRIVSLDPRTCWERARFGNWKIGIPDSNHCGRLYNRQETDFLGSDHPNTGRTSRSQFFVITLRHDYIRGLVEGMMAKTVEDHAHYVLSAVLDAGKLGIKKTHHSRVQLASIGVACFADHIRLWKPLPRNKELSSPTSMWKSSNRRRCNGCPIVLTLK